ncbi:MAG: hypothetical protein K8T25_08550 [Planctomycetia bacterium]|nr:hypothetical protein [Planctomycetia bacterium]
MTQPDQPAPIRSEPARLTAAAPLEIRRHAAGTHVSLARQPQLWFVELAEDIQQHESARSAQHLACDSESTSDPWSADEPELPWLADPQAGLYLAGERHLAWFEPGSGRMIPTPGVLWHLGIVAETIEPGGSGRVAVWLVDADALHAEASREITAYDWLGGGAASGDRVIVAQHLQSRRWYFVAQRTDRAASRCCAMIEVRQGPSATPASLNDGTPVPIVFDQISLVAGDMFSLATGTAAGEVTVLAAGRAEIYHHAAAHTESTPSGDNLTEWRVERKPASSGTFGVLEQTILRMHHPNLDQGQETKFLSQLIDVAYGDTLRVQARRIAGSDTLASDTLSGGTPTCYFGLRFVCCADARDHAPSLTTLADATYDPHTGMGGAAYEPTTGAGRRTLKLAAYYRLEESGSSEDRADYSGQARTLRVLTAGVATISGVSGHIGTAAQIDASTEWLGRGGFGDPNPESDFRPASQVVSVAGWIQLDGLSGVSGTANLVGIGNDNSWRVVVDASGNVSAIAGQTGGMGHPDATATVSTAPLGKPLFVVATFAGLAGRATLRIRAADGSFDHSASDTVTTPTGWGSAPGTWHVDIGSTGSSWAALLIEQLGIWFDAPLTPAQQNYLFAAGAGRRLL